MNLDETLSYILNRILKSNLKCLKSAYFWACFVYLLYLSVISLCFEARSLFDPLLQSLGRFDPVLDPFRPASNVMT